MSKYKQDKEISKLLLKKKKSNGKIKLFNVSMEDVVVRGDFRLDNISDNFRDKLKDAKEHSGLVCTGTFVLKSGKTRVLTKKNYKELVRVVKENEKICTYNKKDGRQVSLDKK